MAEFLSAGVFVEEVPSQVQVTQAVTTSTLGIAGFTPQGPTNEATLVSSFADYTRKFGSIDTNSFIGLTMASYFANGGRRAYVVRVAPSDSVQATGAIESKTYDQSIETGTGSTAAFSKTALTTTLKVNSGASPIVANSFALRWRGSKAAVGGSGNPLRVRDLSADLTLSNGTAAYEGRVDTKAILTITGAANGNVLYRSVGDGRSDIRVAHVIAGMNTALSISVTGTDITVNVATDGGGAGTSVANDVVAAILASAAASALVVAAVGGTGAGLVHAQALTALSGGIPSFDASLSAVVRGTMVVLWNPDGVGDRQIAFPAGTSPLTPSYVTIRVVGGASLVNGDTFTLNDGVNIPTVFEYNTGAAAAGHVLISYTNIDSAGTVLTSTINAINGVVGTLLVTAVSGGTQRVLLTQNRGGTVIATSSVANAGFTAGTTAQFESHSGFVSLLFVGSDIPGAVTTTIRGTYTPATGDIVSGSRTSFSAFDNGTGSLVSTNFTAPGSITYATGAYNFTTLSTAMGNDSSNPEPHNLARIVATYKIKDFFINPVSNGAWGNNLRLDVFGNPDFFTTATATYSKFNANVLLLNTAKNVYEIQESYEELDMSTPTSPSYFADVINQLSDLVTITEPAGNEPPGQLAGVAHTMVVAGGGAAQISVTLSKAPIAPRTISVAYVNASGTALTATDDGNGNMTGSIDTSGTNTIVYATGVLNVKLAPSSSLLGGHLVVVTYSSAAEETTHQEIVGDTTRGYTAGSDGTFTSTTYGRNQFTVPTLQPSNLGIYALNKIEELMQVALPDFAGDTVTTEDLIDYAEGRTSQPSGGDRFIILTVPKGSTSQKAVDFFRHTLNNKYTSRAAMYWPWVNVADPLSNGRPLTIPPLGHIAGVYARTDNNKNVGKSPGGTVDGLLNFILDLETIPTQGDRDLVYQNKINPLISSPQTGMAVWGVRTLASPSDSDFRYINARRLFMFVEKSVFNSLFWAVFENNGPALWGRIATQINGFLGSLFTNGYFAGTRPSDGFFVTVDSTINTPATIDAGEVLVDVGIAPNKPAEFVVLRFSSKTLSA